jgi:tetratricopeptide (TPR) repeat protein
MRPSIRLALAVLALAVAASTGAAAQTARVTSAREAVARNPNDPAASLALGRALRRAGIWDAAATELRRGALLGSAAGDIGLAIRRELARVFVDQGKHDEAMNACRQIAPVKGGQALSHACVADAHMIRKRATEALPEVERALALSPSLYEAKVVEGYVRWQTGALAAAEQAFKSASGAEPSRTEAWVGLGRLLAATGRKAEAIGAFEKAAAADADDPEPAYELGAALASGERATAQLRRAVDIRPSYGAAHARLGEVALEQGRVAEAEQEARVALRCPNVQGEWHALLAEVLVRKGQADEALKAVDQALKMVPNNSRAKLAQADAFAAKRDIDLAIEAYQASFNIARTNPAPLVRASLACLANARETTAKAFSDRATQLFPKWAPAWEAAGDVAAKAKEHAEARKAYQQALAGEGPADKDRIRRKIAALP